MQSLIFKFNFSFRSLFYKFRIMLNESLTVSGDHSASFDRLNLFANRGDPRLPSPFIESTISIENSLQQRKYASLIRKCSSLRKADISYLCVQRSLFKRSLSFPYLSLRSSKMHLFNKSSVIEVGGISQRVGIVLWEGDSKHDSVRTVKQFIQIETLCNIYIRVSRRYAVLI